MPTVRFEDGLQNVLVVTGADIHGLTRGQVTDVLHHMDTSPKQYRDGLYDFTVLWWHGRGGNANHNSYDPGATPRPLRGRIYIPSVPTTTTAAALARAMYLLAHETLHHWMVSPSITVRGVRAMPVADFVAAATAGRTSFARPPLLARQNLHWTPYWQSDDSVLDGTRYEVGPRIGAMRRWDSVERPAVTIDVPDGPRVTTNTQFSDLDLLGMGAKSAAECYPEDGGRFRWMEPRYVGPIRHRIGTMVAFRREGATVTFEFGFADDYDRVVVARDGAQVAERNVPDFDPFTMGRGLMLRIVADDDAVRFEARIDDRAARGCARLLRTLITRRRQAVDEVDMLAELGGPPDGDFSDWTLVHREEIGEQDEAVVGMSAQASERAWVDLGYRDVHLMSLAGPADRRELEYPSGTLRTSAGAWLGSWALWPAFSGRAFLPSPGARVRADSDGSTHLMLPHRETLDADSYPAESFAFDPPETDGGARVLWKAPGVRFAFAASAAPHSILVAPWIGGSMNGKYLIGLEHRDPVTAISFRPGHAAKRTPPPDDTYRIAHVVVGREDTDITIPMVEGVDLRRRAFDAYFEAATGGLRKMDSTLEDA